MGADCGSGNAGGRTQQGGFGHTSIRSIAENRKEILEYASAVRALSACLYVIGTVDPGPPPLGGHLTRGCERRPGARAGRGEAPGGGA